MRPRRPTFVIGLIVAWLTFAGFAASLRLIAFHDDVYNIPIIAGRTLISVFDIAPYGHRDYRPIIAALWLLVRDLFGTFSPAVLHFWSVAVHVLTTALVMLWARQLARQLAPRTINRAVFVGVAGLLFAFFPFSQQAVLWAGAIGHPLMTMFGLMSAWCALVAVQRTSNLHVVLAAVWLLCGCLSHEQGFVFGAMVPALVLIERRLHGQPWTRRVWAVSSAVALTGMAYALFYVLAIQSVWSNASYTAERASTLR